MNRSLHILYLHPRSWGGEYAVLRQLRALGHDVCVLEERRGLGAARRLTPDFLHPDDGIPCFWYDPGLGIEKLLTWPVDRLFKRAFNGRNLLHRMWIIAAALRRFRPDAVVCSDGFSYAIPAAFLRRAGIMRARLMISYIGGDILDRPEADVGKRRTPMVDRLIRASISAADVLRPVSPMLARVLLKDGAIPGRVSVCPSHLAADAKDIDEVHRQRAAIAAVIRAKYNIPQGAPTVVTLSGNQKGKGLHIMADAWPAIRAAIPDAHWLLCGPADSWLDEAVLPRLKSPDLADSIHLSGSLKGREVLEHLAAGDVQVNPTLADGLNMVVVEAAAVGTPTISSDAAGIADWILRHEAGTVVPSGDAAAFAAAIIAALQSPATLARWQQGCERLQEDFALERVARRIAELLTDAATA